MTSPKQKKFLNIQNASDLVQIFNGSELVQNSDGTTIVYITNEIPHGFIKTFDLVSPEKETEKK